MLLFVCTFFSLMPGGCNIFCKIRCPHNKGAQTEESNKGKPSVPSPPTPSHTDLKWSPVIDQFQPCLEQNRSLYSCTLASSSLARFHREWERERDPRPPWQDSMKEEGRAVRFVDRLSWEPTLWMVMDCLYARRPPSLILFIPRAPRAPHLTPRSQGLSWRGPGLFFCFTVFGSPWWSRVSPWDSRGNKQPLHPAAHRERWEEDKRRL